MSDAIGQNAQITNNVEEAGREKKKIIMGLKADKRHRGDLKMWAD